MSLHAVLPPDELIAQRILVIRGSRVILDANLADLFGVNTKALNQAVRRNIERSPSDFMFPPDAAEKQQVVTNCDHLTRLKYSRTLPQAFTEHGTLMLGNVLRSEQAVAVSLHIVRTLCNCAKCSVRIKSWRQNSKPSNARWAPTIKPLLGS